MLFFPMGRCELTLATADGKRERCPWICDRVVATKLKLEAQRPREQRGGGAQLVTTRQDKVHGPDAHGQFPVFPVFHTCPKDQHTLHVRAAQEGASNVTVMAVDSVRVSE